MDPVCRARTGESRLRWPARIEVIRVYVTPDSHEDIRVQQQPG
jgi:hypothetical protein